MLNNSSTRIFIIDDDKIMSTVLKKEIEKTFEGAYMVVSTFDSGEQLEAYLGQMPDIAIVDYHLNSENKDAMNGLKIVEMIKKQSHATEVIMCSSEDRAEIAVKAMKAGAHDYILKNGLMFRKVNSAIFQCLRLKKLKGDLKAKAAKNNALFISLMLTLGTAAAVEVFRYLA